MRTIVDSIRSEYLRYKGLAERAIDQLDEAQLSAEGPNGSLSIAVICRHVAGNLRSRFTDFLTTDGEKRWRHREEEFRPRVMTRGELLAQWEQGWRTLFDALAALTDDQLDATVTIRGEVFRVHEALHRSLAHTTYHVGQVVYLAKAFKGRGWRFLSLPPGESGSPPAR